MTTTSKIILTLGLLGALATPFTAWGAPAAKPVPSASKGDGKEKVADCRDGTSAWSANTTEHRGLCSGHGGVASYADGSPVKAKSERKGEYR